MSKPTLALIPSGYKSGKVYSILPNNASGDFDFTRQSIGTRVRKDGLIEEAKTEGSITNLQIRSEEFDNSAWIKSDISVTANNTLAPNGTNTADAIVEGTGTGGKIIYDTYTTSLGVYTFSVYIKKEDKRYTALQVSGSTTTSMFNVDLDNGTGQVVAGSFDETNIETLANDWYRVSVTFTASSGTLNNQIYLMNGSAYANRNYTGNGTDKNYVWGAMLSEGALSDYIKTEGTTETKTVETFTDVPRLDWLNSNCPSLLLESQRTNYALNNTQLQLNNTLTSTATITKTGNYAISPDGTLTATRLQASGTSGYALLSVNGTNPTIDGNGGGFYRSSVYVKSNTDNTQTIVFYGSSTQTPITHEIGNEWERIDFLAYRPSGSKYAYLGLHINNGSDDELDFLAWGGQTELVNSYASSLIYTGASTVTRLKDDCHLLSQTLFTDYPFTVYAKAKIEDVGNTIFSIYGGASNKYLAFLLSSSTQVAVYRRDATNNDSDFYNFTYSIGDNIKVAVAFINDTTYKLYINGTEIADVTSGLSIPFDHDDILLGQFRISADTGARNSIDDFRVYDYTLTDTELTELTTL